MAGEPIRGQKTNDIIYDDYHIPASGLFKDMLQNIKISIEENSLPELGKVGPYFKYVKFPVGEDNGG